MNSKRLHDQLLERMPEGATHDRETCDLCSATNTPEGGDRVTYTEEELQAAIEEKTAELSARIEEMESAARASEVDAKVEAAKAEAQAEIAELRTQLDTAVLEAEAAKSEKDAVIAYLTEIAAAEKAAAEIAARREERLAKVKEVASFPDTYLEANADRFAAMSDEDFELRCAEWASMSTKAPVAPAADDTLPTGTALQAAREDGTPNDRGRAAVRELLGGILRGNDPRNL
jgi:vacuolar-type H+-ATPase subunit I/STV1